MRPSWHDNPGLKPPGIRVFDAVRCHLVSEIDDQKLSRVYAGIRDFRQEFDLSESWRVSAGTNSFPRG